MNRPERDVGAPDPASNSPLLAVVIPAHNSAATLGRTLAAVADQDLGRPFESVVVDDCSTDATPDVASEHGARVIRLETQGGAGGARNAGAAATTAPYIAFTDADCEPAPSWLRAGLAELEAGAEIVTGPIAPARTAGPFDRTLSVSGPSPLFESANVFVTRALFERVGGFLRPEELSISLGAAPMGEDVVFGWRALRSGAKRRYAPEALVRHEVFPRGPQGYIAERSRLWVFPMLLRQIPEFRRALTLRVFLSPRRARFDLGLAGVVAAASTRRTWPLAAAVPYVRCDLRTHGPWRRSVARQNLAFAAADLVGLAALLYGSVVHRRVLL